MKEHLSKKNNFDPGRNFVKCPKLVREAPRATQNIEKKSAQNGPGPNFGPRVGGMRRQPLTFSRDRTNNSPILPGGSEHIRFIRHF